MNCEHRCIPTFRIASRFILLIFILFGGVFAAEIKFEEASNNFSYHWEIGQDELTDFVKKGQISTEGITGSIYYQGRYYPVYTVMLENKVDYLATQIKDKEEINLIAAAKISNENEIDELVMDQFDIKAFSDFVTLQEIPGVGTLLEIIPCLPDGNGQIRCLKKGTIQLFSTNSSSLKRTEALNSAEVLKKFTSLKASLPEEYCALYITAPGFYQISGQDLADKGIDIKNIVPDQLKLYWWGEALPCRVTSTYELGKETFQYEDVIQFSIPKLKNPYGDYYYNPFSNYDVILLEWSEGEGLRYVQENSEITGNETFSIQENRIFKSTVHIEQNQTYQPLARLHEEELSHRYEHEFYYPSIQKGENKSFKFNLWNPVLDSPYNVEFTIRMQGLTYSVSDEMDHTISVKVNDYNLLEDEWEGQQPKVSTNEENQFYHEYLNNGQNTITITAEGYVLAQNRDMSNIVLFDWLEVTYDRYMIAHDNRLTFSPQYGPGSYLFKVEGLSSASNVMILKNGTNWIRGYMVTEEQIEGEDKTYSIYFEDECNGEETYQIAGPGNKSITSYGIENIDSIRYVNQLENEYYSDTPQGDYLIITHKDFYTKAQELAEHKQNMGFTPAIYQLERIYDEYNYGNESPYAIKRFLTDAYNTWSIPPEYVLFIGDTGTKNSLPIIKYQSAGARGAIITESWFVDIDDDFVMEMALGRLPVSTTEQLDSIIVKIKAFDEMSNSRQRNRMALITGPESTFKDQIQDYLNNIAPDYIQNDRLYLYHSGETGDFDAGVYATDTLTKFINDGVFCINYLGHGGGYTWDNNVLPYSAFDLFKGGNPFIVNSMTCYTNTFSNDNALGEMFIRHPRGGVAVLSSTAYGWINSNYYIFEKLMGYMMNDHLSQGKATQLAMTDYFFSTFGKNANFIDQIDGQTIYKYFRKSLFYQMCILGDPSVGFPKNEKGEIEITPKSVANGSQINIHVSEANIVGGSMDIVGSRDDERKFPIRQKVDLNFVQGNTGYTFSALNEDINDGLLQMIYWDNNKNYYTAQTSIAFNAPFIDALDYDPHQPSFGDTTAFIRLQLEPYENVDSVKLRVYNSRTPDANYKTLDLVHDGSGIFKTSNTVIYTSSNSFYVKMPGTGYIDYYTGNYFMPVIYIDDQIITGDYYKLTPEYDQQQDVSILSYGIENGKSKLVLSNQADTSVNVLVEMFANERTFSDTVLTVYDVDGQYESGYEKINTFYYDFLPAYGTESFKIKITPLTITDSDSTNNQWVLQYDNKWLYGNNGHFINADNDTLSFPGTTYAYIMPGKGGSLNGTIYLNNYNRNYNLSEFGASQDMSDIIYINTPDEEIDFIGSIASNRLGGDKMVCYLSTDLGRFYRLPLESSDTLTTFPIKKSGYYLVATSTDNTNPSIELNINAREILSRGYVSKRSDFSVIVTDDHGVNPLPEFWSILLDGEELEEEYISVVSNDDISEFSLNFKLEMEPGDYKLQVVAQDLVGNQAETEEYEIVYNGESQLIDYGNYPNPFTYQTTFIYELTEQFSDVTIKIFTLSGQKIYTMSVDQNAITDLPLYSIGYHEVPWEGMDEFGNSVANGVYFYVIEATIDGKKIQTTGKIAKLL